MSVRGKDIFGFDAAGYPGDIVFSYDDLTIEHPEFLKLDGGAYKKADYPQIEKYFNFNGIVPYNETIDLAEFNETKTDQVDCGWLSSQNGDDIALIYFRDNKKSSNDRMYYKLYLSHDGGATFTKVSESYFSSCNSSTSYSKKLIRLKDKTMLFYKSSYSSDSGYIYCYCLKDGETSWKQTTVYDGHDSSKLHIVTNGDYVFVWIYDKADSPTQFVRYADIAKSALSWATLDAGSISVGNSGLSRIANTDKIVYGNVIGNSTDKFRIYNPDLTYTEYSTMQSSLIVPDASNLGSYDSSMLFYRNGEYVMLPGGTSYGYFVVKTTDFITWTGYVRENPAYAVENSSEIYYYGETDKQLLFKKSVMNEDGGPIAARNKENFTIEGNGGVFTTGLSGYVYTGISDTLKKDDGGYYIVGAIYQYGDTTSKCIVQKKYIREVNEWFKLPLAKTISAVFGASSSNYPYIRTE